MPHRNYLGLSCILCPAVATTGPIHQGLSQNSIFLEKCLLRPGSLRQLPRMSRQSQMRQAGDIGQLLHAYYPMNTVAHQFIQIESGIDQHIHCRLSRPCSFQPDESLHRFKCASHFSTLPCMHIGTRLIQMIFRLRNQGKQGIVFDRQYDFAGDIKAADIAPLASETIIIGQPRAHTAASHTVCRFIIMPFQPIRIYLT